MSEPAQLDAIEWWGRFLSARHGLIHAWTAEGRSPEEIAETLSMDPMQVRLIAMTDYVDHTFGELPETTPTRRRR